MHVTLRRIHCFLGLLPLASKSNQFLVSLYSWIVICAMVFFSYYFELLTLKLWALSNPVSAFLGVILDLPFFMNILIRSVRFHRNRKKFRRLVNLIDLDDIAIFCVSSISFAMVVTAFSFFTYYMVRKKINMFYVYHTTFFLTLLFNTFLVTIEFCATLRSLTRQVDVLLNSLSHPITSRLLTELDFKNSKIVSIMKEALCLHTEFLILICLDVFSKSVSYLYIVLFIAINNRLWSSIDYVASFLLSVGVRVVILVHLTLTCSKARKSCTTLIGDHLHANPRNP